MYILVMIVLGADCRWIGMLETCSSGIEEAEGSGDLFVLQLQGSVVAERLMVRMELLITSHFFLELTCVHEVLLQDEKLWKLFWISAKSRRNQGMRRTCPQLTELTTSFR